MIWDRERYIAHSLFEYTGAEMFCELFGPLLPLEAEWRRQGANAKEIGMTAFDWDYVLKTDVGANCGAVTGIEPKILSDNEEETISIDHYGRQMRLIKKSATLPLPLNHPVENWEDWLKIKHWYAFSEERINPERLQKAKELRDKGYLTILGIPGGFDEPRQLMGEENLCVACYEEPELIGDMLTTIGDTCVKVIERVGEVVSIDNLTIHEDMAGKSGPLFGPSQVLEFLKPYYLKAWNAARQTSAKLFSQDSDGNMNAVIDAFIECGLNAIYPCEPNAGMDIVEIRKKYGKQLMLKGGIDKFALRKDPEAIRRELEYRICPETLGGGTVFALDHRIPNGVPIENYRYYVNLGREMLGKGPILQEGWERMAF